MNKKHILGTVMGVFAVILVCTLFSGIQIKAAGQNGHITPTATNIPKNKDALLYVTDYSVTNQTIIPGKEFTLKMTLKNFSSRDSAENVVVMIDNPEGVVPEYGTVSVEYIDKLAPNSSRTLKFAYTADSKIEATELNFMVYVNSDAYNNTTTPVRIAVGTVGDIIVEDYNAPEKYAAGKTDYISAQVQNASGGVFNNVVMVAMCDDKEIASANIGTMPSGASKTQYVSVTFDEPGKHSYELLLKYTDEQGTNKEYSIGSGMLEVSGNDVGTDVNTGQGSNAVHEDTQEVTSGSNIVIMCTIGVLMIAVGCVVLILLYRRK